MDVDAPAPVGHRLAVAHSRHGDDAGTPETRLPVCQRSCVRLRRRCAGRAAAGAPCRTPCPRHAKARNAPPVFLREGEDPDSIVGREGRAAFEERFAGATPLSEVPRGAPRVNRPISSRRRSRRFVALARPCGQVEHQGSIWKGSSEHRGRRLGSGRPAARSAAVGPRHTTDPGRRAALQVARAASGGAARVVTAGHPTLLHYPATAETRTRSGAAGAGRDSEAEAWAGWACCGLIKDAARAARRMISALARAVAGNGLRPAPR